MPELPDLQVISMNLSRRYSSKALKKVIIFKDKKLNVDKDLFLRTFEGSRLLAVEREGKELHMKFDNDHTIGLHLMLKGEIYALNDEATRQGELFPSKPKEVKHKIIEFIFEDNSGFVLTDFMAQAKPIFDPPIPVVPDALSEALSIEYLEARLGASRNVKVKSFLVNQEVVRGIGNAYADEILWHCLLSPFSSCDKIPAGKVRELATSIRYVLGEAVSQIKRIDPDLISGEIRSFMAVHTTKRSTTPNNEEIIIEEFNGKKTYFTKNQVLYE